MKRRIILIIEILCIFALIGLFLTKHFFVSPLTWTIVIMPLVLMGIIRSYMVMIIAFHSLTALYRWLRWKITGKVTIKTKVKKRKRGYNKAKSLKN